MQFLREVMLSTPTKDKFSQLQRGPVLLAAIPGTEWPRTFNTRDSSARTREVELTKVGLPNPDSTSVYTIEKSDRNPQKEIICGRGLTADVIVNHDSISKHHASFELQRSSWQVCDLGSRNGTKLREVTLAANEPHPLGDKAELMLGECVFMFYSQEAFWKLLAQLRGAP